MLKFCYLALLTTFAVSGGYAADVEPLPAPLPPPGPLVILTAHALDGHGGTLEDARIGVADGKITSLAAPHEGAVIDLRGYTVMPGWIDTHVHLSSHWDRTGRIATETEPPLEASLEGWFGIYAILHQVNSFSPLLPGQKLLRLLEFFIGSKTAMSLESL